jgi:hypothetical protein
MDSTTFRAFLDEFADIKIAAMGSRMGSAGSYALRQARIAQRASAMAKPLAGVAGEAVAKAIPTSSSAGGLLTRIGSFFK